ncbi:MAG: hypothetical protein ABL958_19350, partial [Bdellovibrionia bacterium]
MKSLIRIVSAAFTIFALAPNAHADLKELQAKITQHLNRPEIIARIDVHNAIFDKTCAGTPNREPQEFIKSLKGGTVLRNYEEILPKISRFEFPSYEALLQSHSQGVCDHTITLNMECLIARFDKDVDGYLSETEKGVAQTKLKEYGAPETTI